MCKEVKKGECQLFPVKVTKTKESVLSKANCAPQFQDVLIEFEDGFQEELLGDLPRLRGMEFKIDLIPDAQTPVRSVIRLLLLEFLELKRQLQKYLTKGLLRPSSSPHGGHSTVLY